jgi:hypothetical protein
MSEYNDIPWSPETWPALVDKPYCARPGCPNPASHVEFAPTGRCYVRALCRWHTPALNVPDRHLPISEYLERRAGGLVRRSLTQLNEPEQQKGWWSKEAYLRALARSDHTLQGAPFGRKLR